MLEFSNNDRLALLFTLVLSLAACSSQTANPIEGDGSSSKAFDNVTANSNKGSEPGSEDPSTPGSSGSGDGTDQSSSGVSSSGAGSSGNGDSSTSGSTASSSGNNSTSGSGNGVSNGGLGDGDTTAIVAENAVVRFVAAEKLNLLNDTPFVYIERSVSGNAKANVDSFKSSVESTERGPLDLRSPYEVNSGAKLVFRSSLDVDAVDIDILTGYFQSQDYDVKDINVSPDGKHLIFAAHGPEGHPHDNTWNIYELGFQSGLMRRIIKDDAVANGGHDTSPTYTLDGAIVFSSDRSAGTDPFCFKIGPDEKPSLLHSMSNSGEDILQLTHGENHDIKPTTMKDGRISFVRWSRSYVQTPQCDDEEAEDLLANITAEIESIFANNYPAGLESPEDWSTDAICAYTQSSPFGSVIANHNYTILRIEPDGSELDQLYETVSIPASDESFLSLSKLVQAENGKLVALLKHEYSQFSGGNLLELQKPGSGTSSAVFNNIAPQTLTSKEANLYPNQLSSNGWYSAVWPYRDGSSRLLISWAQCLTVKGGVNAFCKDGEVAEETDIRYGVWVYDPSTDSRLPIVRAREDVVYSELAVSQPHVGEKLPHSEYLADYVENANLSKIESTETSKAFPVILRDFRQSHPDFEASGGRVDYGIVADLLGDDGKPVYARASGSSPTTSGAENFDQWYNTIEDVNVEVSQILELTREQGSTLWEYSDSSFFPLDGLGWDAISTPESEVYDYPSDYIHNYHFTLEAHLEFDYQGGEEFSFRGDDDLWVYINGKLVIDIGGIHAPLEESISLDELAEELGIEVGKRYSFDLFFAERHLVQSNFRFQTSINLECVYVEEQ